MSLYALYLEIICFRAYKYSLSFGLPFVFYKRFEAKKQTMYIGEDIHMYEDVWVKLVMCSVLE